MERMEREANFEKQDIPNAKTEKRKSIKKGKQYIMIIEHRTGSGNYTTVQYQNKDNTNKDNDNIVNEEIDNVILDKMVDDIVEILENLEKQEKLDNLDNKENKDV